jgi:hypothetical protein
MAVYTTDFGMLCDGSLQGWLSVAKSSQMRKDKHSGSHQKAQIPVTENIQLLMLTSLASSMI